ncbi:tetratricopeptide repeat protein [Egbenema bharatensis]|uniref:tetratricopeptide repeat protein n=1 Tax=Egbenema bharatensis TaxID=3463334 RepID=UPI003A8A5878
MSDSSTPTPSERDRHLHLIDHIVQITLKGQLRSKEQIYQLLVQDVPAGSGEMFERCLQSRLDETQVQLDQGDELKQAKASRILRALQAIQGEWERYQKVQGGNQAVTAATQALMAADAGERLSIWLDWVDPNRPQGITFDRLKGLAQSLVAQTSSTAETELPADVQQIAVGIRNGLKAVQELEPYLIQWVYEVPSSIGFEGTPSQWGPWKLWARQVNQALPRGIFAAIAEGRSIVDVVAHQGTIGIEEFVELVILFQYLQRGLITWFEKQPYDSKWGTKQSVATFLTFAVLWSQLSIGFEQASVQADDRPRLIQGCFHVMLQILRQFSQQSYFPLYGGVFALLSGNYLQDALSYLDAPLRQVPGTQEKSRILTLIGYSHRALGQYDRAIAFHQQALEIAQTAEDQVCEVANLNHLSRIYATQKNYEAAIRHSQRALVLSRQSGDRQGEANALTNLGYSEVLSARQLDRPEPDYEMSIHYLQQGLNLAERLGDRQSQSLCYNSLGIAYVLLEQPQEAIRYLEQGPRRLSFQAMSIFRG